MAKPHPDRGRDDSVPSSAPGVGETTGLDARGDPHFRDRVRDRLTEAFGPPQEMETESGKLYRWVLRRESGLHAHVYLTLDSPELPTLAHVLVSDPGSVAVEPITSRVMRTLAEVDLLIERIKEQLARAK